MIQPKVCVLRTAGTNCDKETAFAFERAGGRSEFVHINSLLSGRNALDDYQILAIPGGFSYGDDVAAGKILANELKFKLGDELKRFVSSGKLIIGICNGFQVLVKSGLLPGNDDFTQEVSLIINDSAKFEDRWVYLCSSGGSHAGTKCIWTKDLPEVIYLPVAHGEGKFVPKDKKVLDNLKKNRQIVFQYSSAKAKLSAYPDNPNGSRENIAGICDQTGRIFGLMPHPERHIHFTQAPKWFSQKKNIAHGLLIFKNGVEYAKKNL